MSSEVPAFPSGTFQTYPSIVSAMISYRIPNMFLKVLNFFASNEKLLSRNLILLFMKLVSACLLGINCNFEGKNWLNPALLEEFRQGGLFPVCPEVFGGLPVPRLPAEIVGGDGADVLAGKAKVLNMDGVDVTCQFLKGAQVALKIAQSVGAKEALLIEKSPSCGCGRIFDGSFSDKFIAGDGVTAALLKKNNIHVTCVKVMP
jgi:uncharacterized protein YbbK (DUF523 family)